MKKSTTAAINEFVALVGGKTWTKTSHACTGKWCGTYDHSIVIDGRHRLFVTNGMTYFEERIREWSEAIKRFRRKKEEYLNILRKQTELDNRNAREEGLQTIEVADIGILSPETTDRWFFFMPYVLLKVGDRQYKFMESSLSHALFEGKLEMWLPKYEKQIYTAGGVQNPDFIFGNVRFNSKDSMYRIPIAEAPSVVKAKNLYEI
ncbi:MAG: hypothetical protein NC226_05700 [Bacteroides cellulosilyticus]|nr:hypothetical protein [Bacteroides cellulosilyticus]